MAGWDSAAAATWNRHLSALVSFITWAQRQELLATNPARRLQRRTSDRRGDRAIPAGGLFSDDRHPLRERLLWRMPYETAARAEEILSVNVEDLDTEFRRARVRSKGGAVEYVHWATATARLLPRLLQGRQAGPVFSPTAAPPPSSSRAGRAGPCTSSATARSSIWPRPVGPRPSCRQSPAISTWPASAATSAWARRPPPASPPSTTPPTGAAVPADRCRIPSQASAPMS
jgi:integrase